jgi:PadR family transcriptional regulator PadR
MTSSRANGAAQVVVLDRPVVVLAPADQTTGASQRRPLLGEFEHQVLVAVRDCGGEAYGLRIAEMLLGIHGGSLAIAQVYVTLRRLEKKGFLSSQTQAPRPIRGGRARRVFNLEGTGEQALEQSTAFRRALVTSAIEKGVTSASRQGRSSPFGEKGAALAPAAS